MGYKSGSCALHKQDLIEQTLVQILLFGRLTLYLMGTQYLKALGYRGRKSVIGYLQRLFGAHFYPLSFMARGENRAQDETDG